MNFISPLLRLAGCAAVGILVAGARADPPATPDAPPPPAIAAPGSAAPSTDAVKRAQDANRSAAPDTAAIISAGLPKYAPPKPEPPPKPESELPDLRDIDKPKNEIIRLPKYVVRAAKPPIFREQDIYTAQGLADLAVKRYLSDFDRGVLNRLTVPLFGVTPEERALAQYQEDLRLKNIADLNATANAMSRGGDSAEGAYIKRETQDTYMNGIEWGGTVPKP